MHGSGNGSEEAGSGSRDQYAAIALRRDEEDTLAHFRDRFHCAPRQVYLDGNSLGLLSIDSEEAVLRVLREWRDLGVSGWLEGDPPWFLMADQLARDTAPLIGAAPHQVAVTNSTTVNLHQLLATLFEPDGERTVILADALNFPSDLYALRSHLRLRGLDPAWHLRLVASRDGLTLDEADIIHAMTPDVGMALLPSVLYASGQLLDMERLAAEAARRHIALGFDCSHSIGAVPHMLDRWGVDFAFWCSYKYLNSGPGAIGGLYLNQRHLDREPGLAGWFGNRRETQFAMSPDFDPAPDACRLHVGTPPILSMAPLQGALKIVHEAGIENIRHKSLALTEFLAELCDADLARYGVTVATPRAPECRGGHVALAYPEAARVCKALKAAGVIPDFRPPNLIRLAPTALYNSFNDCLRAVRTIGSILQSGEHLKLEPGRGLVA